MSRMIKRNEKGFTLIELMVVVAIIGILAALAIPMYQAQVVKARLAEVTHSMGALSSAVGRYYQDNNSSWPPALTTASAIANTLGLAVPVGSRYIESVSLDAAGKITSQIQNTGISAVDTGFLTLTPSSTSNGAMTWSWGASAGFPVLYLPRE